MADFNYVFPVNSFESDFFKEFYEHGQTIIDGLDLFFNNNTITNLSNNNDTISLLGYAYSPDQSMDEFLLDILSNFNENKIPKIKKTLHGQYILLITYNNFLYVFSDILQVRSVYYSVENKSICSRYNALSDSIKVDINNVNDYKLFEYLAMKEAFYPSWLLNTTFNDNILRLRPFEYLKVNIDNGLIEVNDFVIEIDNTKNNSLSDICHKTHEMLKTVINHELLKEKSLGLTLTGGFDSRLISFIAKSYYSNTSFRIAINEGIPSKDLVIAKKIAKISNAELNILKMDPLIHQELFYTFTDRLSPKENTIITPMILSSKEYDLGLGGAFGSELYNKIYYNNIDDYIDSLIISAKKKFINADLLLIKLEQVIRCEFDILLNHYKLKDASDMDTIRLFMLMCTGSFSSPMISANNIFGNNYEPYGTFPIIELGFQIPDKFMNNDTSIGKNCLVQKNIMNNINKKISRVETTRYSPMAPLSICTLYSYIKGHFEMKIGNKVNEISTISTYENTVNHWKYLSDDWCEGLLNYYAL